MRLPKKVSILGDVMRGVVHDFWRALHDKVFWLVLLAGTLGACNQSPWFIVPIAILLTLFSVVSDEYWFNEFKKHGLLPALWWFWFAYLLQNGVFVALAFFSGHLTRWIWF